MNAVSPSAYTQPVQDSITVVWKALVAEPFALLMAVIALTCAIPVVSFGVRVRDRLFLIAMALLSGFSAWIIASHMR